MRPTDFCHPYETALTRTSRVPGSLPRCFHRVGVSWSLGSTRLDRGKGSFTVPQPLRRTAVDTYYPARDFGLENLTERGLVNPTVPYAIEPMALLSPLPLSVLHAAFAS